MVSRDTLVGLQEAVLRAVLLGVALPGQNQAIRFPDLNHVLDRESVIVSDTNLAGSIAIAGLPRMLRILSPAEIREEANRHGQIAFLEFTPPEMRDGTVRLGLHGKIRGRDPTQPELGLSSILVTFAQVGDQWTVLEEPVFMAH